MGSLIKETPYSEITSVLEILDRYGVGRDDLKKFRTASSEVQSHIAHIFKTADTCIAISSTNTGEQKFIVSVDYDQTIEQMVETGKYAWANTDVYKCQLEGDGVVRYECKLFHYRRRYSKKMIEKMMSVGWEPAKVEHLLSFGATYPNVQTEHSIVALGSVTKIADSGRVLHLDYNGHKERGIHASGLDVVMREDYRYLGVRKIS